MANAEAFDAYFRQADHDKDGRVSGAEAVAFFKGANLPQLILAKIWQYSDQGKTGFLSRAEFYNALKLVTIAQSGRELTPEIAQAAFAGPATIQIPAPKIALGPSSVLPPTKNVVPLQTTRISNTVQHPPPVEGLKAQYPPTTSGQIARPAFSQVRSNSESLGQSHSATGLGADSWVSSKPPRPALQIEGKSTTAALIQPLLSPMLPGVPVGGPFFQAATPNAFDSAAHVATSAGAASGVFSTTESSVKNGSFTKHSDVGLMTEESAEGSFISGSRDVPAKVAPGISAFSGNLSGSSMQARHGPLVGANPTQFPTSTRPNTGIQAPPVAPKSPSTITVPTDLGSQGFGAPASGLGMAGTWPKMSQNDVERYSRVFIQVDTDKDGKISGVQARDLFLSWKLPRELLKQVWDLSDQDGDSMLSLREFCTALYLMERHREGRPLPPALPAGFFFEDNGQWQSTEASRVLESPSPMTQKSANNMLPSQQLSGFLQPPASVLQIPASGQIPLQARTLGSNQADSNQEGIYKTKAPALEMNLVNQLSKEEQDNLKSKQKDAEEADKKVYELEKDIMDFQKKIESYRTKLQEIILLKSRCDNRLAEVTERSAAERREVETLARKYDAKFKQAGEVNSRLQAEEAMFRDIQERKMELYNSIAHIEQGDTSNSLPQAHIDRLAADLHELKKILNLRAKQIGLRLRPSPSSEATFGGQLEIQESFVEWDEDWDKFDDEGFTSIQELSNNTVTSSTTSAVAVQSTVIGWDEDNLFEDKFDFSSEPHIENNLEVHLDETSVPGPTTLMFDSPRAESEAGSRSSIGSPQHDTLSPRARPFGKSSIGDSLLRKASSRYDNVGESQDFDTGNESFWPPNRSIFNSDRDDADKLSSWESELGGNKYEVESDIGETWGLKSTTHSTKTSFDVSASNLSTFNRQIGARSTSDSYSYMDSLDFGSLRVSTSASRTRATDDASDFYGTIDAKGWGDHSDTSVPGTPLFKVDSPRRSPSLLGDEFNDGPHSFSRFDSISSTRGGGRVRGLASFDEGDPFAGTGPFGLTTQASKSSEHHGGAF